MEESLNTNSILDQSARVFFFFFLGGGAIFSKNVKKMDIENLIIGAH